MSSWLVNDWIIRTMPNVLITTTHQCRVAERCKQQQQQQPCKEHTCREAENLSGHCASTLRVNEAMQRLRPCRVAKCRRRRWGWPGVVVSTRCHAELIVSYRMRAREREREREMISGWMLRQDTRGARSSPWWLAQLRQRLVNYITTWRHQQLMTSSPAASSLIITVKSSPARAHRTP